METVPFGSFAGGLALLCAVLAAAGFAGWVGRQRWFGQLTGLEAWLVVALVATLALATVHWVPLALGILSKGSVLVASAVLAVATFAVWLALPPGGAERAFRAPIGARNARSASVGEGVAGLVAWGAGVVAVGAALVFLRREGALAPLSSDALNFQIPQLARWIQTGSLWQLDQFFPLYSNATYPHHGNMLLLAVVLPFDSAFLARWVPVPFAALTCLAVFAAAREAGATRGWATLAGVLPAAIPVFVKVGLQGAQTDTPMTFGFALALLFLLRHRRTQARGDLVVAGLGIGLAAATKWYAYSQIPPMVVVWAGALLLARVPARRVVADTALLAGIAAAVAAPWLVRNLVEAGNPMFPQPLGPFTAPDDPIREQSGFTLLYYATDVDVWREYLLPQFTEYFAGPGYLLFAAPLLAGALALRRRAWPVVALALAALGGIAAYAVTPFGAFGAEGMPVAAFASTRYAVPALLVAAVALAWAGSRLGPRGGALAAAAVGLLILHGLYEQYRPEYGAGLLAAGAAGAAAAAYVLPRVRPRALAAGTVAALLAGVLVLRDDYDMSPYAAADPTLAWLAAEAPEDRRIALAGVWSPNGISPVLPAFGPRLRNHVAYLGPFVEHLLRPETDPDRFRARLRGYDLLVVGRGIAPTGAPAREERWARAAGFEPVAESDRLALLRRAS